MSYQYKVTERRNRRTTSPSSFGASANRSTFGFWVPLVVTVTAAAFGVAAWIWSERREDEDESSDGEGRYQTGGGQQGYGGVSGGGGVNMGMSGGADMQQQQMQNGGGGFPPGPGPQGMMGPGGAPMMGGGPPPLNWQGPPGPGPDGFQRSVDVEGTRTTVATGEQDTGLVARMSSALGMGRSASPGQAYNFVSSKVVAGAVAATAMVGGALGMSGGQDEFADHDRWSEEADRRDTGGGIKQGIKRQGTADEFFSGQVEMPRGANMQLRKRRTVAIVVSSVEEESSDLDLGHHASILSHLPEHISPQSTRIFVLIYAPALKTHPLSPTATRHPSQSMASSFSNISATDAHTPAQTPGEYPEGAGEGGILENVSPNPIDESGDLYKTLHNQAQGLVERDTMILPFTSENGHKHILKSLGVEVVYIQESLCGRNGEIVSDLSGWVRQTVVVIGDEGGQGGLVDTDDEGAGAKGGDRWWMREERTGLGKRVAVVESLKVGDDWERRINEKD